MNIAQELVEHQTVLLIIPGKGYNQMIIDMVKQLSGATIGYVTLNKTFDSLKEIFQKNNVNIEKMVFIDAVSKSVRDVPDQTDGCYFVSSPSALTELSYTMSKLIKHNIEYMIFDSLTNLLVYEKEDVVAKFASEMINKARANKTKSVFYALNIKEQEKLIEECEMFVDKVIDLSDVDAF